MNHSKTAIVLGATGLVGSHLVQALINDPLFSKVKLLVRRATNLYHPKIEEIIVDFENLSMYKNELNGAVLFSCMGTTLKKVGTKAAQYRVDFTYQYEVAKMAAANGVGSYVLVSSSFANPTSKTFYLKMKGSLDEAVKELPFQEIRILRPSVLMGKRIEQRTGEQLSAKMINTLGKIIPKLKKYRSITGEEVALSMIAAYKKKSQERVMIEELDQLFKLLLAK